MMVLIVSLRLVLFIMIVGVLFFNFRYILVMFFVVVVMIFLFVEMLFVILIIVIFGLFVSFCLMVLLCFSIRLNMLCGRFILSMILVNVIVLFGVNLLGLMMMVLLVKRVGVILWVMRKNGKFYGRMLVVILSVCLNKRIFFFGWLFWIILFL